MVYIIREPEIEGKQANICLQYDMATKEVKYSFRWHNRSTNHGTYTIVLLFSTVATFHFEFCIQFGQFFDKNSKKVD